MFDVDREAQRPPLIILGAARSGTTLLGKVLEAHPDVVYVEEPQVVWRYRNAHISTDMLPSERATPEVVNYIRRELLGRLKKKDGGVLVEKTPANSLRPFFVQKVFPEAKFLHILRNGRSVVVSAVKKWEREEDANAKRIPGEDKKFRRLRIQLRKAASIPLTDVRHYIPIAFDSILFSTGIKRRRSWGPRFPGINEVVDIYSKHEVCAMQWKASVDAVRNFQRHVEANRFLEVRYEDLTSEPGLNLRKIVGFAGLDCERGFDEMVGRISGDATEEEAWMGLDEEDLVRIDRIIGVTLRDLGYL